MAHALRQGDVLLRHGLIGNLAEQMRDAVEPGALLVDRLNDPPRRVLRMGAIEHLLLGAGIVLPVDAALHVHRRELPLLQGISDPHAEAEFLLLVRDREPVFDQNDAGAHEHMLEIWNGAEELFQFVLRAEPHDPLDAGAVVPAAVEQHHFASRRQMRHIALEIPLVALALGWRRQRHDAADSRIEPLRHTLDSAALAGRVAPFEEHDNLELLVLDPVLKPHEFMLQAEQLPEINLPVQCRASRAQSLGDKFVEPVLLQLQLQFLVEAVGDLGFDPVQIGCHELQTFEMRFDKRGCGRTKPRFCRSLAKTSTKPRRERGATAWKAKPTPPAPVPAAAVSPAKVTLR